MPLSNIIANGTPSPVASSSAASLATLNIPTSVTIGADMIAVIAVNIDGTNNTDNVFNGMTNATSPWTLLSRGFGNANGADATLLVFHKKVISGEPATYTCEFRTGLGVTGTLENNQFAHGIAAWTGGATTGVVEDTPTATNDANAITTTVPCPSLTTSGSSRLVIRIGCVRQLANVSPFLAETGLTTRMNINGTATNQNNRIGFALMDAIQPSAGSTGIATLDTNGTPTGGHVGTTVILKPDGTEGTPDVIVGYVMAS